MKTIRIPRPVKLTLSVSETNPLDILSSYVEFDTDGYWLRCRECGFEFLMITYITEGAEVVLEGHDYIHNRIMEKRNTKWWAITQHDKGCCISCQLDNDYGYGVYDFRCCCKSKAEHDTEEAVLALYGAFRTIARGQK